jgi:hypothetical protein
MVLKFLYGTAKIALSLTFLSLENTTNHGWKSALSVSVPSAKLVNL